MEEEQVKKKKIILISSITIVALILVVGISYALWQQTRVQEGTNYIASGCFGVQFEGNNPINLANSFPITTEDGMKTTPYTFTITNTCNGKAAYDVNLESLSNTTFQNTSIRVALDETNKLYSEYSEAEPYYNDSVESRRLISGRLEANESVTYTLRIWIDEAVTIEEQNKTFASKIVVNASEDFDDPEIIDLNATSTIDTINIIYNANGDISTTCKWGIEAGTYDNEVVDATNTNCTITGLTENTTYYYQICTETGKGSKCVDGSIKTIQTPSLSDITATSTTTGITLTYTASGDDITTTCKYGTSTNYGSTASSVTNSKCSITGLRHNTTYYYQLCITSSYGEVCKDGNIKTIDPISDHVEIGEYISMTPTSTSYTISKNLTGYDSDQTINPSELNLWRVINKNDDGTVDMVSHYVSSTDVYFHGLEGYINLIKGLNTIASQYTDGVHVASTRHIGFSKQTQTITLSTRFTDTTSPWDKSTSSESQWNYCSSATYLCVTDDEHLGAGDLGYNTDYLLVTDVYGDMAPGDSVDYGYNYWLASRHYLVSTSKTSWSFGGRYVRKYDGLPRLNRYELYKYSSGGYANGSRTGSGVRPIVTLKSTSEIKSGGGYEFSPYTLK